MSGPIRKVGGGGGGGAVHFKSDIRKVVGGGGAIRFRSDTKSRRGEGGGGGGSPLQVRYLCLAHSYMYLSTYYLGILHTRARMNLKYMPAKVNLLYFFFSSM